MVRLCFRSRFCICRSGLGCRLVHGCPRHLFGDRLGGLFEFPNALSEAAPQLRQLARTKNDQRSADDDQKFRKPKILEEGTSLPSVSHMPSLPLLSPKVQ